MEEIDELCDLTEKPNIPACATIRNGSASDNDIGEYSEGGETHDNMEDVLSASDLNTSINENNMDENNENNVVADSDYSEEEDREVNDLVDFYYEPDIIIDTDDESELIMNEPVDSDYEPNYSDLSQSSSINSDDGTVTLTLKKDFVKDHRILDTLDRTMVSDVAGVRIISSIFKVGNVDLNDLTMSRSTVYRSRNDNREQRGKCINSFFINYKQ